MNQIENVPQKHVLSRTATVLNQVLIFINLVLRVCFV